MRGLVLLGLLVPLGVSAQDRPVVSKEISVGRAEASLKLEFSDTGGLEIVFDAGEVRIDGTPAGSYEPGDDLDREWRSLLGKAVALDDGPLGALLRDWAPPETLDAESRTLAETLDASLEAALTVEQADPRNASSAVRVESEGALMEVLLGRSQNLVGLAQAISDLSLSDVRLVVDEDFDLEAGETLSGTLIVVEGQVRIAGTLDGDLVVVEGNVDVPEGGHITGDLRLANAHLHTHDGVVDGDIVDALSHDSRGEDDLRDRLRSELRREIMESVNVDRREKRSFFSGIFGGVFRAVGSLVGDVLKLLILAVIGAVALAFAGPNMALVSETARAAPGRAAMVGLAGVVLMGPVWVVGIVALAVSIVGIPVMIAWIPLFPLAALAALIMGYLAVSRNVGEWLADNRFPYTEWIVRANPVYTMAAGLMALSLAWFAIDALYVLGGLGKVFQVLLGIVGVAVTTAATLVGFGAVLLTRGGRQREYYATADFDAGAEWKEVDDEERSDA
ncbi:MAG: hypothetical protein OEZ65_00990 [Gemmatimonadota bacterium]|nr:hypothetical protein [Gemmatimonadota bacterium]MDH5758131.1 hypothetical protein [Gemmatimonadota bacterium]